MEHFIALSIKQAAVTEKLPRLWYHTVVDNIPEGLVHTVTRADEQIKMLARASDGKMGYTIPLIRHLTDKEVGKVIRAFDDAFKADFVITASKIEVGLKKEIEVAVPHDPLVELCTAWAKQQHDEWMQDKLEAGWRYGPSVSTLNKTHPLLRQWSDLPEAYRKVNTSKAEELLKLFNEHGYLMVKKDELDKLVNEESHRF